MAISAEMVRELREKTGAGMMDCKRALEETGGDFEKAANLLRQKGVAVAAKRESKATNEGTIGAFAGQKVGALVELACETDFVARTDEFQKLASDLAALEAAPETDPNADLLEMPHPNDPSRKVADAINDLIGKLGEKIVLKRAAKITAETGAVGVYVHTGGKIGVLVEIACQSDAVAAKDEVNELARDIAMQIAWGSPQCVRREELPAEVVEQEKEVYRQRAINEGKPEAALEKIVAGRLEKFYSEVVLLDQPFIRDANVTVGELVKKTGEALGETIEVRRFERFRVGE